MKEHELYWLRRIRQYSVAPILEVLKHSGQSSGSSVEAFLPGGPLHDETYFLTAWQLIMHRYTAAKQFLVACPLAEGIVFLPCDIQQSFDAQLQQTAKELEQAALHSAYDFSALCKSLLRNTAHTPQSLYTLAFFSAASRPEFSKQFDLCLQIVPEEHGTMIRLWYAAGYDEFLMQQLLDNYLFVVQQQQLVFHTGLEIYTTKDIAVPKGTLTEWFERQVQLQPSAVAVKYEAKAFTYDMINQRANRLAFRLIREAAVMPGAKVGFVLQRSEQLIITILAILKAGACYVPIDPNYPEARQRYIIEDTALSALITDDIQGYIQYAGHLELIACDEQEAEMENPALRATPESIAYIIYTSGSTGQPKGVEVSHANVISLLSSRELEGRFGPQDKWTLFHSVCFDFSVWEIFGALLYGGCLIVVPYEVSRNMAQYAALLEEEAVSVLNMVPTVFSLFKTTERQLSSLRYLIFGGEALDYSSLKDWKTAHPDLQLINMYGITETTVHVTFKEIDQAAMSAGVSNIGKALSSLTVYVMDADLQILPTGVMGELVIGGAGVTRGYLNKPEQTALAFITHPLGRLYRSGDLGRMLPDGDIIYMGRKDTQVKLRGFRIETGEILHTLLEYPGIEDARVIIKGEGEYKYLAAYLICEVEPGPALKQWMQEKLPEHMVPAYFIKVSSFPLTANGKLDISKLPDPETAAVKVASAEALTPLQRQLQEIWERILKTGPIDISQNFFETGGHSLLANRICIEVAQQLHLKLNPAQIFLHPTIRELAVVLGEDNVAPLAAIKSPLTTDHPASYAQRRLWSLHHMYQQSHVYNMPVTYRISGVLDVAAFREVFNLLVKQHDSLRTSLRIKDDALIQEINPYAAEGYLQYEDLSATAAVEARINAYMEAEVLQGFDLSVAPLFRAKLVKVSGEEYVFFLTLHHIIADGWSIEVLVNELIQSYNRMLKGAPLQVNKPAFQYRDYAWWQHQQIAEKRDYYRDYWRRYFGQYQAAVLLPPDYERSSVPMQEGALVELYLDHALSESLKQLAAQYNSSLFMLLMTALNVTFSKLSGSRDISIAYPVSGRSLSGMEAVVGLFVNTLVLRTLISEREEFIQLMERIKERIFQLEEYQEYPFDLVVEDLNIKRIAGSNPLFDIGFTWHAEHEQRKGVLSGCRITELKSFTDTAKADLWVHGTEKDDQIYLSLQYNTQLFKSSSIHLLSARIKKLLQQVAKHPRMTINEINLAPEQFVTPDHTPFKIDLDL